MFPSLRDGGIRPCGIWQVDRDGGEKTGSVLGDTEESPPVSLAAAGRFFGKS
ncbi:hypothetical protein B4135_3094 [Caldibacillus debilis]|uniref:Uncharacterized protein n=1 Tax=Caldibacillus debilis TaxID=301148 RepID=A0A150LIV4_9BACI|nr:hypothetical protein B4135_3094 [Caldibacillus debilis]